MDPAARTCERFGCSVLIVEVIRFYYYHTWPTHLFEKFTRWDVGYFLECALRVLSGCEFSLQLNCRACHEEHLTSSLAFQVKRCLR